MRRFATFFALAAAAAAALPCSFVHVSCAAFTPGNVVVLQIGDGLNAPSTSAQPSALIELSSSASTSTTPVQTISFPKSATGAQAGCTNSGTSATDGLLSRSLDGRYIVCKIN